MVVIVVGAHLLMMMMMVRRVRQWAGKHLIESLSTALFALDQSFQVLFYHLYCASV